MLKWLGYICVALLLIALITSPTEKEWKEYVYATAKRNSCKPVIEYRPYKIGWFPLFSITSIKDCPPPSAIASTTNSHQHKYLGLFGTFWRL